MKFLKRRQNQETNQQINNEEELGTLKAQTIKELIAPSGIDASKIDYLEINSAVKRYARSFFISTLPRMCTFPELFRDMYMFGDIKEHLVFLIVHMQQKMMEQTLTVKK